MPSRSSLPTRSPLRSRRGFAWSLALLGSVVLCGFVLAGLWIFRLHNRIALAATDASITATELDSARHDLEVERLVTARLSADRVDLGSVRIATLSPADATTQPAFAVVWSPASGEGVLLLVADLDLPAGSHFQLTAIRRPASDRQTSDPVFDSAIPAHFNRGLFTYHAKQPIEVVGFNLLVTTSDDATSTTRYGGGLRP